MGDPILGMYRHFLSERIYQKIYYRNGVGPHSLYSPSFSSDSSEVSLDSSEVSLDSSEVSLDSSDVSEVSSDS